MEKLNRLEKNEKRKKDLKKMKEKLRKNISKYVMMLCEIDEDEMPELTRIEVTFESPKGDEGHFELTY